MLFKKFNVKEEIVNYNRKFNANIDENESFGFHYFVHENLERTNYYLDLINDGDNTFIYSSEGGRFVKELNSAARSLKMGLQKRKKYHRGAIYNNTPYTPEEIRNFEDENRKNKAWSDNIKKQANVFSDETFWVINQKVANIEEIKKLWLRNSVLAAFNDATIFKIASETLPMLIAYHKEAFIEISKNKHQIPKEIHKAYLTYLKDFQERATKMQRLLIDSMLTRLKAYDLSKGAYSNPVIYIHSLIKYPFERPYQPSALKPNEFDFYHQYIRLHGNYKQKKEVYERRWYTSLNNIPTKLIKTEDGNDLLVPQVLSKNIPVKTRWPNWIFWAANIRYNLFKDKVSLMASLKDRVEINNLFVDITLIEPCIIVLNDANKREELIQKSLTDLEKYQSHNKLLSWFSPTTKVFLENWKKILIDQQKLVIEDKINLARKLTESFRSELLKKDLTVNIPWSAIESLLKLKDDLEKIIETDKTLDGKVYGLQTILTQINRLTDCHKMLALTANGKDLSQDELDKLLNYITNIQNEDSEIYAAFIEHTKPLFHKIRANLINELQVNPFNFITGKERNFHQRMISISTSLLERIADLNEYHELDDLVLKYTLNYLRQVTSENAKYDLQMKANQCDNLKVCEDVLKIMSGITTWQDKPLNCYLDDLQKEKMISNRLFKAKCINMVKELTLYFESNELNNNLKLLDEEMILLLKEQPYLYTDKVIRRIMSIRDDLASGKTYESLSLSLSDENLLGKNNPEREEIWKLIRQSVYAKQVQIALKNHEITYSSKIHQIEALRLSFSNFLKTTQVSGSIKNKQWFQSQTVLDQFKIATQTIKV